MVVWFHWFFSMQSVYVQITNKIGSTTAPPVTVQASVMSALGSLLPQRLKQLAKTITGSPAQNLGLNNTVFGKVKSISLSSYLKGTLRATPPSPSPAPSPANSPTYPALSPYPAFSSANSPTSLPNMKHQSPASPPRPCSFGGFRNPPSPSPSSQNNPTVPSVFPPSVSTPYSPPMGPTSRVSPDLSPMPEVSYAPSPDLAKGMAEGMVSPSLAPLLSCKFCVPSH